MSSICHLISGDLWAGAEVMAFSLLSGLSRYADIRLSVILLNEGRLAAELRAIGLTVHVFDEHRHSFPSLLLQIHKLLRDDPPDIIHAHRYKENQLAFLASLGTNRPVLISTLHGLPEVSTKNSSFLNRCKSTMNFSVLARYFTRTVAVSADIGSQLCDHYGFAADRVKVIHNGVALPEITSNTCTELPRKHFTIGSSGRLFPVKDFALFVEIASIIAEQEPTVRFELAGEGPGRSQLEGLLALYGLQDRFVLHGHIDDMEPFYSGLDLYLNTSLHEGIPMTILEAMAHGIPVIAPCVGGIGEIIASGEDGFLIDGRDPRSFADKCLQLYRDQQKKHAIGMAAREKIVREFSVVKMSDMYYRLYCEAVNPAVMGRKK